MADELRPEVFIGDRAGDHLSLEVLGRMHDSDDFWDGNWLVTHIDIVVGGFRGTVGASLRADELQRFKEALEKANASLEGEAVLESMERWVNLKIAVQGTGRLVVTGTLADNLGKANHLTFEIEGLDQTYLNEILGGLEDVETFFPVLGSP